MWWPGPDKCQGICRHGADKATLWPKPMMTSHNSHPKEQTSMKHMFKLTGLTHAKLVSLTSPCCSGWPAPMNTPPCIEEYSAHDWWAATPVQRAPVTWREWGLCSNWPISIDDIAFEITVCNFAGVSPWHDDVIKWKHFPRCWPFVRGIHRSPVNSLHKGQWRGALRLSLIFAWTNG